MRKEHDVIPGVYLSYLMVHADAMCNAFGRMSICCRAGMLQTPGGSTLVEKSFKGFEDVLCNNYALIMYFYYRFNVHLKLKRVFCFFNFVNISLLGMNRAL